MQVITLPNTQAIGRHESMLSDANDYCFNGLSSCSDDAKQLITGRFTSDMYAGRIIAVLLLSNRLSIIYDDRYEFALSPHFA